MLYQSIVSTMESYNSLLDYYDDNDGYICDNENDVIRSQDECTTALKSLGYQKTTGFWTQMDRSIPVGCSVRNSGDMGPHFIQSSTGLGNGRSDLTPICKRAKN